MATRYSGDVTVRLEYVDAKSMYRCRVTSSDGSKTIWIKPAPASRLAVDSAKAYDEVASAAISFAEHEGLSVQPVYGDSSVEFHRRRS